MLDTAFNINEAPLTRRDGCPTIAEAAYFNMVNRPAVVNPMTARLSAGQMQDLIQNEQYFRSNVDSYTSCRGNFSKDLVQHPEIVSGVPIVIDNAHGGQFTRQKAIGRQIWTIDQQWAPINSPRLPSQEVLVGIDTRRQAKDAWKQRHGSNTSAKRGLATLSRQVVPSRPDADSIPAPAARKLTFGELLFAERQRMHDEQNKNVS